MKPEATQAYVNLGVVLHESGDEKGAADAYDQALKQDQDLPAVRYNLALLRERQGDSFEAENYYEQLLADHADWPDACFVVRARQMIGYYVKIDDLVDAVIEGLQKAGLGDLE